MSSSIANQMQADAKKALADQKTVIDRAVQQIVEEKRSERTNLIISAYNHIHSLQDELSKIKPDNICYDVDGNKVSESYSKKHLDTRGSVEKKLSNFNNALELAINNGDYAQLIKLVK